MSILKAFRNLFLNAKKSFENPKNLPVLAFKRPQYNNIDNDMLVPEGIVFDPFLISLTPKFIKRLRKRTTVCGHYLGAARVWIPHDTKVIMPEASQYRVTHKLISGEVLLVKSNNGLYDFINVVPCKSSRIRKINNPGSMVNHRIPSSDEGIKLW